MFMYFQVATATRAIATGATAQNLPPLNPHTIHWVWPEQMGLKNPNGPAQILPFSELYTKYSPDNTVQ